MTLVIPDGFGQVLHSITLAGDPEPYAITYGIDTTAALPLDVTAVAQALHTAYDVNINPTNANVLTLSETLVRVKTAGDPDLIVGVANTPEAGAGGSTALVPQNTALLVHKRTAYGGRTGRGRMYFPGLNEANVGSTGEITAGWIATMNGALADWLDDITAITNVGSMVLLHDSLGAGAALPPRVVFSLSVDTVAATQRRRLRR